MTGDYPTGMSRPLGTPIEDRVHDRDSDGGPSTCGSGATEDHIANIHILDEHRGIAHRCMCGDYVVSGMLIASCKICLELVMSPDIQGVEPIPSGKSLQNSFIVGFLVTAQRTIPKGKCSD